MSRGIAYVLGIAGSIVMLYVLAGSAFNTGPGCPADPTYLGYCSDLED